jgi:hypothetical protein
MRLLLIKSLSLDCCDVQAEKDMADAKKRWKQQMKLLVDQADL